MRMKNDELRAGYNVQAATENGFVAGFSISQNANDGACFIEHLKRQKELGLPSPKGSRRTPVTDTKKTALI